MKNITKKFKNKILKKRLKWEKAKSEKKRKHYKQMCIDAIKNMQEFITIYEDDDNTILTTEADLNNKSLEVLMDMLDQMLDMVNNEIK